MTLLYMVCDVSNVDPTTHQCTQVQYVQAPAMLPPMDLATGAVLSSTLFGVWALAAYWRSLTGVT
ncbi:hypothetical protein [Dyella sp.]|uniref:hypothetical protein n=1 Tax=Dyella sp. TaxID=1869338 RepID=UPI00284FA165|nr:hypothetical protein [Dyella sp.]MDR3445146.1 hypothetical protein [Dyella sp.]